MPDDEQALEKHYDVIIVGGGSSGGVLASRLSEDSSRTVLLIEAGPDYPDIASLPDDIRDADDMLKASLIGEHFWTYTCRVNSMVWKDVIALGGRVTGGGSAVNATYFLRGISEDYDHWAALGNGEWAFDRVLPYFKKSETDLDFSESEYHGGDGPIPVWRPPRESWSSIRSAFSEAAAAVGFADDPDMNHPETTGVGVRPFNSRDGVRMSTAATYLASARHRPNLTILDQTLVLRILFQSERAVGVEVRRHRQISSYGGTEVVLCAGAIESPALLVRSGIGSTQDVRGLGIELVAEVQGVGRNLRNHPAAAVRFPLGPEAHELTPQAHPCLRYTAPGSSDRNNMSISPLVAEDNDGSPFMPFYVVLRRVGSAGRLTFVSTDPEFQPLVEFAYLTEPSDFQHMRAGLRLAGRIGQDSSFASLFEDGMMPSRQILDSDAELDPWIWANMETTHHQSGTCKMGRADDTMAVVDQYGVLRGVEGVRIADASIMPDLVRADTTATVVMMAERIAGWMTGDPPM